MPDRFLVLPGIPLPAEEERTNPENAAALWGGNMNERAAGVLILDHDGAVELVSWEKEDRSDLRRLLLEPWMARQLGCDMIAKAALLDPKLDPAERYRT